MSKKVFWFLYFAICIFLVFLIFISSFYSFNLGENILLLLFVVMIPWFDKIIEPIKRDLVFPRQIVWNKSVFLKVLIWILCCCFFYHFFQYTSQLILASLFTFSLLFRLDERFLFLWALIFLCFVVGSLIINDTDSANLYAQFVYMALVLWVVDSIYMSKVVWNV